MLDWARERSNAMPDSSANREFPKLASSNPHCAECAVYYRQLAGIAAIRHHTVERGSGGDE